jgi:hypothetical protein
MFASPYWFDKKGKTIMIFTRLKPVLAIVSIFLFSGIAPACAGRTVSERINSREFPSVFEAWSPADNLPNEAPLVTCARHDLYWTGPGTFGLRWNSPFDGLGTKFTSDSIAKGLQMRRDLLKLNPNMILLTEIRYRDAYKNYLPQDSVWWQRETDGQRASGWDEGGYFKLAHGREDFQNQVAAQAHAAVASGVFDGIMLDWWNRETPDRIEMLQKIRKAIGPDALIIVNSNDQTVPESASYVNGIFMECDRSDTAADWKKIATTLEWAENHLRKPHINCVETWYQHSREDYNLMRATTTLALTLSNGYCLFSDPDPLPTPDHLHDWYPFWRKTLGKPAAKGYWRKDGMAERAFQNGVVVYNPCGNGVHTIQLTKDCKSLSTGLNGKDHIIQEEDGDIFLYAAKQSSRVKH